MKDTIPIITKIDTANLIIFNSLKEFAEYFDKNFTGSAESMKLFVGS